MKVLIEGIELDIESVEVRPLCFRSIKDELPPEGERVLVYFDYGRYELAELATETKDGEQRVWLMSHVPLLDIRITFPMERSVAWARLPDMVECRWQKLEKKSKGQE